MTDWTHIDGLDGQALLHALRADRLACADHRREAVDAFRSALALTAPDTAAAREVAARLQWLAPA